MKRDILKFDVSRRLLILPFLYRRRRNIHDGIHRGHGILKNDFVILKGHGFRKIL
jgi:hypothetical protein